MDALDQAAEECRKSWVENIRHLTSEKNYQDNKDSVGIHIIPYAFKAGVEWQKKQFLISGINRMNERLFGSTVITKEDRELLDGVKDDKP